MPERLSLFDDLERADGRPAAYGEDSFAFLNRAEGAVWARIRCELDGWFAAFPPEAQADVRGRFRSRIPGAHWGAWWELFLHRLFVRLGYRVRPHPEVPNSTRRPDFELVRDAERLYLE